jgi:hypothetical protein
MSKLGTGSRLNDNKTRHDLLEPFAINELAKVFTKGNFKYPEPPHNWLHGMKWSKCVASLKRHINAFERGEDFDFDPECKDCQAGTCLSHTGLYHMAHAAWNCLALVSYYKWFPQGDDRLINVIPKPKIGLDIDEVLCDWIGDWCKYWSIDTPTAWFFDYKIPERFEQMKRDGILNDFYLGLKPRIDPKDIHFEPHAYVTSRPIPTEITMEWIRIHGFPQRPVITIPVGKSKVDAIKEAGIDIFVDDRYDNFEELNRAGICCFLMDGPHNQRYDVGFKRIKSLKELKF